MEVKSLLALLEADVFAPLQDKQNQSGSSIYFALRPEQTNITAKHVKNGLMTSTCHRPSGDAINRGATVLVCGVSKETAASPGVSEVFKELVNYSMFAPAFPIKDVDLMMTNGIPVSTEVPFHLFLGASQISRMTASESAAQLEAAGALVDIGVGWNPMAALAICLAAHIRVKDDRFTGTINPSGFSTSDHHPFVGSNICSALPLLQNRTAVAPENAGGRTACGNPWGSSDRSVVSLHSRPAPGLFSREDLVRAFSSGEATYYTAGGVLPTQEVTLDESMLPWEAATRAHVSANQRDTAQGHNGVNLISALELVCRTS